eukprot:c14897_g2_i1 orf=2-196(-)
MELTLFKHLQPAMDKNLSISLSLSNINACKEMSQKASSPRVRCFISCESEVEAPNYISLMGRQSG